MQYHFHVIDKLCGSFTLATRSHDLSPLFAEFHYETYIYYYGYWVFLQHGKFEFSQGSHIHKYMLRPCDTKSIVTLNVNAKLRVTCMCNVRSFMHQSVVFMYKGLGKVIFSWVPNQLWHYRGYEHYEHAAVLHYRVLD